MKLILCIDKKNGMAFNHRRQTRDKEQREHMYKLLGTAELRISPYSVDLLKKERKEESLVVSEDFLCKAKADEFVFAEIDDVSEELERADIIYLYRWDKVYLSDVRFQEKALEKYTCVRKEKIKGVSHEKITFEEYRKNTYHS